MVIIFYRLLLHKNDVKNPLSRPRNKTLYAFVKEKKTVYNEIGIN